jgi:hypothetical protein
MRMVVVVVIAAVPRAGTVIAAARVLRALPVVMADDRVLADTLVADAALAAIPVIAALGADASLGVPVLAAEESIAAVELVAAIAARCGHVLEAAEVSKVLAALILGDALVTVTAGVAKLAEEQMARAITTADFAAIAVLVGAAFRIGALANFVADRATQTVVIGAAIGTERAFFAQTATRLTSRAFRNVGAEVVDTGDAGAEVSGWRGAVSGVAALAARHPDAVAADAVIQIDAQSAFAFLAGGAAIDTGTAVADLASATRVDTGTAVTHLARAAGADAFAREGVAFLARALGTTAVVRAEEILCSNALHAGSGSTGVRKRTVASYIYRIAGSSLRPGIVQASSKGNAPNHSPKESLDCRTSRGSPRERPGQGVESSIVHKPFTPFAGALRRK